MFMEQAGETHGKQVRETNISSWRRAICSDLTSAFRPYDPSGFRYDEFVDRNLWMQKVYNASFKDVPSNFSPLSDAQIREARENPDVSYMPVQEKGTKESCALPYELYADGKLGKDCKTFEIAFRAADAVLEIELQEHLFTSMHPEGINRRSRTAASLWKP